MLLGLTGKKQAGKDTAFRVLRELFGSERVRRVAFAEKLYASAAAALGVTVEQLNEWKINPNVRIVVTEIVEDEDAELKRFNTLRSLDVRQYLQLYGTEAHRDIFGDDFWVDQLEKEFDNHDVGDSIVVVTDTRFANEAYRILHRGGQVIRIVGPDAVEKSGDTHASETSLPPSLIDAYVSNQQRDGDFSYLAQQLEEIVRDIEEGEF